MTEQRDVFLCHAAADKSAVVRPLAKALEKSGITYWYDEAEIRWGDSITKKVNEGLGMSLFVLVVLSEAFVAKKWPQRELNAALNMEASCGQVRVLPLLVGKEEQCKRIRDTYPIFNDKAFMTWDEGLSSIVSALESRLSSGRSSETADQGWSKATTASVPIPKMPKRVTQRDKDSFLRQSFLVVVEYFKIGSQEINRAHPDVEMEVEEIHKYKFVCTVYRHGSVVNRCKIWLGGLTSSDSIAYFAGTNIDINNDNSLNDWLSIEDTGPELGLRKSSMGFDSVLGDFDGVLSPQKTAEYLWLKATAPLEYS